MAKKSIKKTAVAKEKALKVKNANVLENGDAVTLKNLSPNRLFLSNLRFSAKGILSISSKDFNKAEVQRAIQLKLLKVIDNSNVEELEEFSIENLNYDDDSSEDETDE